MEKPKNFADCHIHLRGAKLDEIEKMLDGLVQKGVTHVGLMSLPYHSVCENLSALYWKTAYKKMKLYAFGGVHFTDRYAVVPFEVQAQKMLELGFDGIKLIDMGPDVRRVHGCGVNDERYDKMFSLLEEHGVPVLMHVANPETFWGAGKRYANGGYLSKEELYAETFEMLDKHPRLNVILAHFFFLSDFPQEAERVLEKYPNVKFDLTPGNEMYPNFSKRIGEWREFFIKYRDRILFGTDTNTPKLINSQIHDLVWLALTHDHSLFKMPCYRDEDIRGLALDEETVEYICYKNFARCMGEPKTVDKEKFEEACKKMLAELRANPVDEVYAAWVKAMPSLEKDNGQQVALDFLERVCGNFGRREDAGR